MTTMTEIPAPDWATTSENTGAFEAIRHEAEVGTLHAEDPELPRPESNQPG